MRNIVLLLFIMQAYALVAQTVDTLYIHRKSGTAEKVLLTYIDSLSFKAPAEQIEKVSIGDEKFGGIVFYIDLSGKHGLVCSQSNVNITWTNGIITISQQTLELVGTGLSNTRIINSSSGVSGLYAAQYCRDLNYEGYHDWYLPSKDELNLMYQNLALKGMGGFASVYYWTSTHSAGRNAWAEHMGTGQQIPIDGLKKYYVRAVRTF